MKEKFNIIICDKRLEFCNKLMSDIQGYFSENLIECEIKKCISGTKCLEYIDNCDILFLAIATAEIDGIEIRERVSRINSKVAIVYTTNYVNRIAEAFGPQVFSFLKKPVEKERLYDVLDKIIDDRKCRHQFEINTVQDETYYLFADQLIYVSSDHTYTNVITEKKVHLVHKSMYEWREELCYLDFYQIHKSTLINLRHVERFDKCNRRIIMSNGDSLQVATRRYTEIKNIYNQYIQKTLNRNIC